MRIWYQSMTELEKLPLYAEFLRAHIAKSCPEQVSIDLIGLATGTYRGHSPMEVLRFPLAFHRALHQVLDNVETAAAAGYDAFLMGSFVAPFLREARCAVDIPVTSMAESVLLTAHSLSRRVGLICINSDQVGTATELVATLDLTARVVCQLSIDLPATETLVSTTLSDRGGALAESFLRACHEAIDNGADLIVPAEGILSELVRANEITTVGGAPVLDCVEVAIAHCVSLTRLMQSGAVGVGRLVSYPRSYDD